MNIVYTDTEYMDIDYMDIDYMDIDYSDIEYTNIDYMDIEYMDIYAMGQRIYGHISCYVCMTVMTDQMVEIQKTILKTLYSEWE